MNEGDAVMERKRSFGSTGRTLLMTLACVLGLVLGFPAPADATQKPKLTPSSFVLQAHESVYVDVKIPKTNYARVCFDFVFAEANPLDPGEDLVIQFPHEGDSIGAVTEVRYAASICTTQPIAAFDFNDGRATIRIVMNYGSASVQSLTVRLQPRT